MPLAGRPPRPRPDLPPGAAAARSGRHRRPGPRSRPVLLSMLAVLVLLLASGTAISLTGPVPPAPPGGADSPGAAGGYGGSGGSGDADGSGGPGGPGDRGPGAPELAALGAAPATPTAPATTGARPDPAPGPAAEPEPVPAPEPPPETAERDDRPPSTPTPAPPTAGGEDTGIAALEDEVTDLTNAEREDAGCDPLRTDERLRTAARAHSEDMAAHDYFSHTGRDGRSPFDRMRDAGYPDGAGENIAYGYRTPAEVVRAWMDSDGHRRNILSCGHRAIGVGLAYDPAGRPYWTQDFGR